MPGFPAPFIKFREDDANGLPLAGGKLYSYAAGTSTPLATYTTQVMPPNPAAVPNLNPTILDASGRASVFIPDGVGYKFVLTDALGNQIWSVDNVQVPQIQTPPAAAEVPSGGIVAYGGTVAPPGWLLCNGSSYATTDYPALFTAILYTFGGAGANFQVPDLRQRFPLGKAASGTGAVLAATGGLIDHTHAGGSHTHAIPAHVHSIATHSHPVPFNGWGTVLNTPPLAGTLQAGGAGVGAESSVTQANAFNTTGVSSAADTGANVVGIVTDAGGTAATGQANPPFLVLNFIIKT